MPPLVHTVGISKRYASGANVVRAVRDVSVSIEHGEFVAIQGRSGSGKSTLLNLLGLLEVADHGEYALNGHPVEKLDEAACAAIRSRDIGFIFQIPALLARTTALENVELPLFMPAFAGRNDAAEPKTRSLVSDWLTAATIGQISSQAESSNGWSLPAPS
jgi:ABC-type lipoprotein export system ATPase subunit